MYGKELILDIHNCDPSLFTREILEAFLAELCDLIDMERCDLHWWDDHVSEEPHLRGISAVQFIKTSNITIHTIELMRHVYLNIFSCKDFNDNTATDFVENFFGGKIVNRVCIGRV